MCDNQAALVLLKNSVVSMRRKHIDVVYHFVRERCARGEVNFEYCPTELMIADVFTKPLTPLNFSEFMVLCGVQ